MSLFASRQIRIGLFVVALVALAIPAAAQMDFYNASPACRIYDSRGGAPLSHAQLVSVQVTGTCGVPAGAQAVALNVTVFGASGDGDLRLFAEGVTPPTYGEVRFRNGKTQAILQIVPLSTSGQLSFRATFLSPPGTYHLFIDVSGYYLNKPPVLTAGGTLNYTENDPPTVVDSTITVADPDDANLQSATVQITGNYQNGQDVLSFANTGTITGIFTAATGTLTLTGQAPHLSWRDALRDVRYENTSDNPSISPRTVTWIANDGVSANAPVTSTINLTATNDAPELTAGGGATPTFNEGGGPVVVDGGILVSDVDDVNLESATVTITSPPDDASAVLAATNCGGLTVTPGSILTISGSASKATYQACLQSVTYDNSSSNPNEAQRSIAFKVNDGDVDSNTLSRPVNLASTNNQPTISAIDDQTIAEDTSTGALAFTVGDAETAAASLTVSGSSSNTSIVPNANIVFGGSGANRTVTVTPAPDATGGPVTITVTVDDGSGAPNATVAETFTVTITAANDQPTITPIADQTINEDTSTGALAFTIGDAETAPASLTVSGSSSDTTLIPNGNIVFGGSGANRTVTVTPAPNLSGGPVTITITVDDGSLQPNSTTTETFTVTVTPVNDQPTISDVSDQVINEDTSTGALAVTVGDQETPVASLTLSGSSSNPALIPNGNIVFGGSGANRTVTVTPAANASGGPVTITITVDDGAGQPNSTASDTFTVTITSVNDQPTITPIADQTINEDTSTGALAFTIGDVETPAGSLTVTRSSSDQTLIPDANVVLGGSGSSRTVTVTPAANASGGPVTVTITVDDGSGQPNSTVTETFTVTVTNVNDQPTVSAIADQTIDEDTSTSALAFTIGDIETPAASLTVSGSSSNPALIPNGNIVFGGSGANRTVTVTPTANAFGGPVTITITVDDGSAQPNSTAVETFTVTINSVNDQPTITPIADQIIDEDTSTGALAFTIGDVETAAGSLTIGGSSNDLTLIPNGNIVFGGSGASRTVTVTPAPNLFGGPVTITVTVNDGSGAPNATVVETFTVTVNPVNDAPTALKDRFEYIGNTELRVDKGTVLTPHVLETTSSTLGALDNDSDLEGNAFVVSAITVGTCTDNSAPFDCTDPAVGTVHMDGNGKFTFEPAPGDTGTAPTADCPGAVDQETFTYTLTDNGTPLPASSAGTVVLCRFARVWYVDPAGGAGNGTSASPFNSLTNLADTSVDGDLTDDLDVPGDYIFIHDGTLTGSIEMEANQHLLGEGVALSFPFGINGNGSTTDLVSAGTKPQLGSGADTVRITQAMPVEIAGLSLSSTAGNALDLTTTAALSGSGTLAIRDNELRSTTAEGMDINLNAGTTGTLVLNITNNSGNLASVPAGNAIDISRVAGTLNLNFSGNTSLVSSTNNAVAIASNALGGVNVTGFSGNSVHGNSQAGIAMSQVVFDANLVTGGFQQVDGDNLAIGDSGNSVLGAGLTLTTVQGNLFFDNLGVYAGGSGLTLSGSGGMTFAVTPNVGIIRASNGAAVDITGATIDLQLDDMDSTTSAAGVSLSSVGGTFSADTDASIIKASGGGTAFSVANSVSGTTVTYGGSMNVTSGSGVSLSSNGGSTISFSGPLTLSTGANTAFSATGGGTVTATNTTSMLTTTTGTALNVSSTTIGSSGLKFQSISVNGASNGIVLNTTGSTGGLTVSGTGTTPGTGGTIQNTTSRGASFISASNITLKNMNFNNAATTNGSPCSSLTTGNNTGCNAPIHMDGVTTVLLDRLAISGSAQQGINGRNVTGFTLSNSTITGIGGEPDENGVNFFNMLGTSAISSTSISGSFDDNLNIQNAANPASGSTVITISGSQFNTSTQGSGIVLGARGTSPAATMTVNVSGCTIDNNFSGGIPATAADSATLNLKVSTCTIINNNDGIEVSTTQGGNATFDIFSNTSINNDFLAINIFQGNPSTGTLQGKIRDNPSVVVANGRTTDAFSINKTGNGTLIASVTNNTISYGGTQRAILVQAGDGDGVLETTVTGNTIDVQLDGTGNAIAGLLAQASTTTNTPSMCVDIGGAGALKNTFTHSLGGSMAGGDIRVRQRNTGTARLPGYAGAATDTAAVVTYLTGRNTVVSTPTATADSTGFGGGGACLQPVVP